MAFEQAFGRDLQRPRLSHQAWDFKTSRKKPLPPLPSPPLPSPPLPPFPLPPSPFPLPLPLPPSPYLSPDLLCSYRITKQLPLIITLELQDLPRRQANVIKLEYKFLLKGLSLPSCSFLLLLILLFSFPLLQHLLPLSFFPPSSHLVILVPSPLTYVLIRLQVHVDLRLGECVSCNDLLANGYETQTNSD